MEKNAEKTYTYEEKEIHPANGWAVLFITILLMVGSLVLTIWGATESTDEAPAAALIIGIVVMAIGWFPLIGLKIMRPNEALVLTLFGKYVGTLKKEGFFFINPFCTPVGGGKLSLKTMTHNNEKQKINDLSGNPIEVGIVVTWRVVNTAKAVFNVQNYGAFLSIQADTTLRDVARCYPYDSTDSDEKTLRGSSVEVSEKLKELLQERVQIAGLEIIEARIAHLAYAQEIAAAMLQRQQATAIIEARQKIVDGAVGMVEMALKKLNDSNICELDEERKAQMVSNLLVVLCGNKDAQPIVNSGSIY
ncbi:MAG: SPFH domain-containing protein [Oscillospiraceae bacterium]|nr:SPFH domain-containing protein [Oscillospiraceae bacterium]